MGMLQKQPKAAFFMELTAGLTLAGVRLPLRPGGQRLSSAWSSSTWGRAGSKPSCSWEKLSKQGWGHRKDRAVWHRAHLAPVMLIGISRRWKLV